MKICDIRDWFAHRINVKSIEEDTEELIRTRNIQSSVEENVANGKEITNIVEYTNKESKTLICIKGRI